MNCPKCNSKNLRFFVQPKSFSPSRKTTYITQCMDCGWEIKKVRNNLIKHLTPNKTLAGN